MGNTEVHEKPLVEKLCSQIILAKAESQFSTVEPEIKKILFLIRKELKDPLLQPKILQEFKSGIKGLPSLIFCLNWKASMLEESNMVQLEGLKTLYKLIKVESSFIKALFEQEIVENISKLVMSRVILTKHISVKILSYLTIQSPKDLEPYSPLYTLNSILASMDNNIQIKTRKIALRGIRNLAEVEKSRFVSNGIIITLLNILNEEEKEDPEEIVLAMECISKSADDFEVMKNLLDEHFVDIIDRFLTYRNSKIQASAASSVRTLCGTEAGREKILKSSVDSLNELTKNSNSEASLYAKGALLSLCLNESKLEYVKEKGWMKDIIHAFYESETSEKKKQVVEIMLQLSRECLKYTIYDLFEGIADPLMLLLKDESYGIISSALSVLVNLCVRIDLQKSYFNLGVSSILIALFYKLAPSKDLLISHIDESKNSEEQLKTSKDPLNSSRNYSKSKEDQAKALEKSLQNQLKCVKALSMISVSNKELQEDFEYTQFFLQRTNRKEYLAVDSILINSAMLDKIEEMTKLAKITMISFPVEELQSKMKDKIKFVLSQCRSPLSAIRCRAAGTLASLASRHPLREMLQKAGFFNEIVNLLRDPQEEVKLVACYAVNQILESPDRIELWLKFDSGYVVDSSCLHILSGAVESKILKKNTGLYSDWGKEFIKSEVVKINDMPLLAQWTVSVWFRMPMPSGLKVLVQGRSGTGAFVAASDDYFFTVEQKNGTEVVLWGGITTLQKGWHHLAICAEGNDTIKGYVDGVPNRDPRKAYLNDKMKYFCNSKKGKEPFGAVCDLRVYRYCISMTELREISMYKENIIDGLPDRYYEYANIADVPTILIEQVKQNTDVVKISALEALANLATKGTCRANMLRNSILSLLVESIRSVNHLIQKHASKCLVNLG